MREDKTNLRTKNFSSSARYRFQAKTKHVNRKKGASAVGRFSDMSESFATSSGDFPTCRNHSPRRRETFRHVGIIRRAVGRLSDMSESFAASSGDFLTCRNRSPRRRETFRHVGIIRRVVGKEACRNRKCTPKVRHKTFWGALHFIFQQDIQCNFANASRMRRMASTIFSSEVA